MSVSSRPVSRYQRRILAWGGGLACLLYVVGAPIYLDRIEADLTERVSADLAAAGFEGVSVSFSGQAGSIRCQEPLGDPREALDVAYAVHGVRTMEDLPDECRVRTVPSTEDDGEDAAAPTAPAVEDTAADTDDTADDDADDDTGTTTIAPVPDFDSVLAVLGGNPQFSLLDQLVLDAGLAGELGEGGPWTLFAPTDSAFDVLPADAVAQLRSDPELLRQVLLHHLVDGRLPIDQLVDGPLVTMAGDEVIVDVGGPLPRVDSASIVEPDVLAVNGVVHALDELLLPAGVDLSAPDRLAPVSADFDGRRYVLQGVVRSEVERAVLVDAATTAVGPEDTVDELTTDPDLGLDQLVAQDLASLVAAVPVHLVSGTAVFDGEMLAVEGTFADDAGRIAMEEIAAGVDATISLSEVEPPSDDDAEALETELNAFVAENPILFPPGSADLETSAAPILDELARLALATPGLAITVEGHTDSDGDAAANLLLSEQRAAAVRQALVDRGLDPTAIVAEGFGSTKPILVDGVEDKDASRRVEFRVVVA